jgi:Tol biopolymer transport system component
VQDFPELSPDDRRVVISRADPRTQDRDLWVLDLARGIVTRTTFGRGGPGFLSAAWSPDSNRIAFQAGLGDTINVKQSNGAGTEDPLFKDSGSMQDWSADGRFIITNERGAFAILPLDGDRKPMPYLPQAKFRRGQAQLSADGRWLAYWSDESGRSEIYVQSFPDPSIRSQASTDGGNAPRWRRDGRELYYLAPDDKLMAVAVTASANTLELSRPAPLFEVTVGAQPLHQYDVTGDGQRFLVNSTANASATPVTVVVNWTAGLKR